MKKTIKHKIRKCVTSIAVTLSLLATVMVPMSVNAADSNGYGIVIKPLANDTWATVSVDYDKQEYTIYSIHVEKAGILSFKLLGSSPAIKVYSALPYMHAGGMFTDGSYKYMTKSRSVSVEEGTYYLKVNQGKCKYSFSAASSQENYCMQHAQKLKANKTAKIYFTPKMKYSRWYKISNPRKKKITITLNDKTQRFAIYNAKRKKVSTVKKGSSIKYCTSKAQPKGTYYIRIVSDRNNKEDDDYMFGKYITLKWN